MDLLGDLSASSLGRLQWHNPTRWEPLPGGGIRVLARTQTDFFQNPSGAPGLDTAHLLSLPVRGDFVAQAHVRPAFAATYDAGALMVRHDERHWAKVCYEATDFGTHAIVSVVTDGLSDDANGPNLEVADVWLQIVRQGSLFAMHYRTNEGAWTMVRYFALSVPSEVQVGLVAQSPTGAGTTIDHLCFNLDARRVDDVRAGV